MIILIKMRMILSGNYLFEFYGVFLNYYRRLFFFFLMENYISFLSVLFYFLFGICAVINHMAAIKIGRSRTKVIRGAWIHWMEKKRRMRAKKI